MPPARIVLWLASLAGVALLARSLWFEPVPMSVAVSAMVAYVALCILGVVFPWLEMFGDAATQADPGPRLLALTFDDGPFPPTTRKVLEHLAAAGHTATFFVLAQKAQKFPELIKEMHAAGHEIAVHGFHHDRLYAWRTPKQVQEDIQRCQSVLEALTGDKPRWFRPPMGMVSPRTAAGAKRAGVEIAAWSVRAYDGLASADADRVRSRVEAGLRDGAIVLLHDASEYDEFEPVSVAVLPDLLKALAARGLRGVTLTRLFREDVGGSDADASQQPVLKDPQDAALNQDAGKSITKRAPPG